MKKLLKPKDLLMLTLAGIGDVMEEAKDPLCLVSSSYKRVYGFIPKRYKRSNFTQMANRSLKTGDIEKIIKGGKIYLRLTSAGKEKILRDFPISYFVKKWNKRWVIVLFDVEEKSRYIRNNLRKKLQHLGFGMLQQSVWITPLPIGKDMLEFVETNNLSKLAFVLEVSHLLLGDPKELVKRVWHLDLLENEYLKLKEEKEGKYQSIENYDGRHKKSEAKITVEEKLLEKHQRVLKRKYLEFLLSIPSLPQELLPKTLQNLKSLF